MDAFSLLHVVAAFAALLTGACVVRLPKGDRRHRLLGWWYVVFMSVGPVGILVARRGHPRPFVGYAALMLVVLATALGASRYRERWSAWRAWHRALMSLTLMGAAIAASSIRGGAFIGDGGGAPFYRMFNALVAAGTGAGLWIINASRVIWGRAAADSHARRWFTALVVGSSAALIAPQWRMALG